jgi:hypothetical protein
MQLVAVAHVTAVPAVVPNRTVEAVVKPVPTIVTTVVPPRGPALGLMLVTVGGSTAKALPPGNPMKMARVARRMATPATCAARERAIALYVEKRLLFTNLALSYCPDDVRQPRCPQSHWRQHTSTGLLGNL